MNAPRNRENPNDRTDFEPLRALVHPLWVVAFAALVLNDLVLKGTLDAPLLTGKLSDVAGLVVAPAVLAAFLRVRSARSLWLCALAVGAVFSAINISPAAASTWDAWIASAFGSSMTWTDPADLWTLPAAAVGVWALAPAMERTARTTGSGAKWVLAGAAAVACLGSSFPGPGPIVSPEPEPRSGPNFSARVALLNQTHELQVLRIRHLAQGVDLDCERVREAPNAYLTDEIFGEPTRWELLSGQQVGLGGAGQRGRPNDGGRNCRAATVSVATSSDIVVFWGTDLGTRQFSANPQDDKGNLGGDQLVELTADYSDANSDDVRDFRYRPCREDNMCGDSGRRQAAEVPEGAEYEWNRNDDQQLFWEALDRNARDRRETPESCLQPVEHPGLTWDNLPSKQHEIREVVRRSDGCHQLNVAPTTAGQPDPDAEVKTSLLCAPWNAVSQLQPSDDATLLMEARETQTFGQDGGSVEGVRISVTRKTDEMREDLGSLALTYGVPGPPLPRNAEWSVPVGCGPQIQSCGRIDLPARLEFPTIETSGPVGVGREVSLGEGAGRVRLVRTLYRPVARSESSCQGGDLPEDATVPRESRMLEASTGIYVEAVTTQGFNR